MNSATPIANGTATITAMADANSVLTTSGLMYVMNDVNG